MEGKKEEGFKPTFNFSSFYLRSPRADMFAFRTEKPSGSSMFFCCQSSPGALLRTTACKGSEDRSYQKRDVILKNNERTISGNFSGSCWWAVAKQVPSKSRGRKPWKSIWEKLWRGVRKAKCWFSPTLIEKLWRIWSVWEMVFLKGSIIQLVHFNFIERPLVLLQIPATIKTVRDNQMQL